MRICPSRDYQTVYQSSFDVVYKAFCRQFESANQIELELTQRFRSLRPISSNVRVAVLRKFIDALRPIAAICACADPEDTKWVFWSFQQQLFRLLTGNIIDSLHEAKSIDELMARLEKYALILNRCETAHPDDIRPEWPSIGTDHFEKFALPSIVAEPRTPERNATSSDVAIQTVDLPAHTAQSEAQLAYQMTVPVADSIAHTPADNAQSPPPVSSAESSPAVSRDTSTQHTCNKTMCPKTRMKAKHTRRGKRRPKVVKSSPLIPSNGPIAGPNLHTICGPSSPSTTHHPLIVNDLALDKQLLAASHGAMHSTGALQYGTWPSLLSPPLQGHAQLAPFALALSLRQLIIASSPMARN